MVSALLVEVLEVDHVLYCEMTRIQVMSEEN